MNEATFTIGPEDLSAANLLHFLSLFSIRRWAFVFAGSALAIALLFFGLDLSLGLGGYLVVLGSVWGIIAAICVWGWLSIPRQARRTSKQAQKLWVDTTVTWDADHISFKSTRGVSQIQWSAYYRWAADDRSILLYQDERTFHTLPLRGFPAGARETIIGYLKTAGVEER